LAVSIISDALEEPIFAARYIGKLRAWICVKDVNVLQVILPVTAADNEEPAIHKSFRVTCSSFRQAFWVREIITLRPSRGVRIIYKKVIEAVGMRARTSKQVEFIINIAQAHASSWRWALALY
jgi:hypothetical protein